MIGHANKLIHTETEEYLAADVQALEYVRRNDFKHMS